MQRSPSVERSASFPQTLDRVALLLMIVLAILIGVLLWGGDRTVPRVRDFSWQDKHIGADDRAFLMAFNRPMDHESVKRGLTITPKLPGKISWSGRRMAYTLEVPAPYGVEFNLTLKGAKEYSRGSEASLISIEPFTAKFQTRDRAFAYIGVDGDEEGRLVLYNLTRQQKLILTPTNLVVMDFTPYPLGDRLLFAATERNSRASGLLDQQLYTVTTGIHIQPPVQVGSSEADVALDVPPPQNAGQVEQVLDNKTYQNLKFDLSANGKIIVVQRVNRTDPADFGPWIIRDGQAPEPLKGQPGGDFLITPDSNSLAISQGQGLAILPLEPDAKPLDFLSKFGTVLNFSGDGSLAAMVKFNTDRTRSLFLVSNQGTQEELLKTNGSVLSAQFDPTKQTLYALLTDLMTDTAVYREEPYLAAIELKTKKLTRLLRLPDQRDVQMSLAPDGLAMLFDQVIATLPDNQIQGEKPRTREGKAIAASRLWLLPLEIGDKAPAQPQPEALPLPGLRPRWLP